MVTLDGQRNYEKDGHSIGYYNRYKLSSKDSPSVCKVANNINLTIF